MSVDAPPRQVLREKIFSINTSNFSLTGEQKSPRIVTNLRRGLV